MQAGNFLNKSLDTPPGANVLITLFSSAFPSLIPLSYSLPLLMFLLLGTMTRPWTGKSGLRLRRQKELFLYSKFRPGARSTSYSMGAER